MCYHMCVDCRFWAAAISFGANPFFGCPLMNPKGVMQLMMSPRGLMTLPTDVFIEDGKIVASHYGKVIGTHMDWSKILKFAGVSDTPKGGAMVR